MSFIAEPADERPKYQVFSEQHGITVALCPSIEWASEVAAALNYEARRRDDERLKREGCKCECRKFPTNQSVGPSDEATAESR